MQLTHSVHSLLRFVQKLLPFFAVNSIHSENVEIWLADDEKRDYIIFLCRTHLPLPTPFILN